MLMFGGDGYLEYMNGTKGFRQRDTYLDLDCNLEAGQDYFAYINPEDIKVVQGDVIGRLTAYGPAKAQLIMCGPKEGEGLDRN